MTVAATDSRRARVYGAETLVHRLFDTAERSDVRTVEIFGSTITLPAERRFASIESVQAYVDAVLALNWVRARWPAAASPVLVCAARTQRKAHYMAVPPHIAVPLHDRGQAWALRELVVLHELAHHLAGVDVQHGADFVDTHVTLVTELVGPEAGFVLRAALHENGAV